MHVPGPLPLNSSFSVARVPQEHRKRRAVFDGGFLDLRSTGRDDVRCRSARARAHLGFDGKCASGDKENFFMLSQTEGISLHGGHDNVSAAIPLPAISSVIAAHTCSCAPDTSDDVPFKT